MNVGQMIKRHRENQNISMNELARLSGIAQSSISEIESGKRQPTFDLLEKIIAGLGLSLHDFFKEQSQTSPELTRLLTAASKLSPAQLEALRRFIETL